MALNFLNLLQQVGAPAAEEILVQAQNPNGMGSAPISIDPAAPPLAPNMLSPEQLRDLSPLGNTPEHKGMFGTKGTLRNILGTIGDAFLVQSGNKQVYAPQRQTEQIGDAMAGFVQNPLEAIQRVANHNPEFAQKLLENYQDRGYQDDVLAGQAATREMTGAKNQQESYKEGSRLFGQFAGAIARNPRLAGQLSPVLEKVKETYGLGDEFVIPGTEADAALAEAYQYGGMPANQQVSTQQRDRQLGISQQNADSNRMRANRPPAGRATPNPTQASIAAPLLQKLAEGKTLTPAEQEVLERTAPLPRSSGTGRRVVTPPSGMSGWGKPRVVN